VFDTPPNGTRLTDTIRADFEAFMGLDAEQARSLLRRRLDVATLPGFWAVVLYRIASRLHARGLAPVARLVMTLGVVLFSCELSPRMQAGPGLVIPHPQGVTMGAGVVLGSRVKLLRAVGMGTAGYRDKERDGWPVIGDDCVVCDGAKVFGPVRVGDRSTIGTSVVLFESVPADSVVALRQDLDIRTGDRSENARSFDIG
jgi:serine O-acetyltransferase